MKTTLTRVMIALVLCASLYRTAAQGTAFTYQGRLNDSGQCADGTYFFQMTLFGQQTGGSPISDPGLNPYQTPVAVLVTNGLFTVTPDFGTAPFGGQTLWMEIAVRTNSASSTFVTLDTRQQISPVPYAIYAETAAAVPNGSITARELDTLGAPTSGEVLTYNGTSLVWSSPGAANAWLLNGNSGTSLGPNFLGTLDLEPLEIRVGNTRAFLLQPGSGGFPNLIGGGATSSINYSSIDPSDGGATIGGGVLNTIQANASQSTISGGAFHTIQTGANNSTIGGGYYNRNGAPISVISGGSLNYIQTNAFGSTIAGGTQNTIAHDAQYAFIGGGEGNTATGVGSFVGGGGYDGLNYGGNSAYYAAAAVVGGFGNTAEAYCAMVGGGYSNAASSYGTFVGGGFHNIASGATSIVGGGGGNTAGNYYATVGGGQVNTASGIGSFVGGGGYHGVSANFGVVGGGSSNYVQNTADYSIIGGGQNNTIDPGSYDSTIGGGISNLMFFGVTQSTIGGGTRNEISGNANYATIGGGLLNGVGPGFNQFTGGDGSTVPGGENNSAGGFCSFAAGNQASAIYDHSFVWSDGTPFVSTANSQFLIHAAGNVGINTSSPQQTLDVNGNYALIDGGNAFNGNGPIDAYIGGDGGGSDVQVGSMNRNITAVGFWNQAAQAYMHIYCSSITIVGGSDLAEPFQISSADREILQGAVVVIDEENPGHLKQSDRPYDTRVAGVVSGANGINPGIQMQQQGLLEGGKNVALTGRVYVQADATGGSIKPGDLLTSSTVPGHAMKVTDHAKAQGAILGKAMTGLNDGKGMVLVLVTLQ